MRSWLHVEDFCDAVDRIAHHTRPFSIFNIAGEHRTNLEVIEAIGRYLHVEARSHIEHTADRPSADRRYAPDPTLLTNELGWSRAKTFDDVIGEVVEWYRTHHAWWSPLRDRREFKDHYEKQSKAQWF